MSEPQPTPYRLDHTQNVPEEIQSIQAAAREAGRLRQFVEIMKEAVHRLETDPLGWGDPEFRSKVVDAVVCHGLIRPVVVKYVVYEHLRAAVILSVRLYADFD